MSGPCNNHGGLHRYSLTIALLIISEGMQPQYKEQLEHPAYEVLERAILLAGFSDDRKADLYARMAERVDHRQPLAVVQQAVSDCLFENEEEFR